MFSHRQVWSAIDDLAALNDMSVSRLARNAGLDPTTFNKSKRTAPDGRQRWPSTESIAKILAVTNSTMEQFTELMTSGSRQFAQGLRRLSDGETLPPAYQVPQSVPLLGFAEAGTGGYFDDGGFPVGQGWDEVHFPQPDGENIYALEISGDSMLPLYRDGDRIIVAPGAALRRGDRVVVRTTGGEVMAKVLARQTASNIELESVNPEHENRTFQMDEVDWMERLLDLGVDGIMTDRPQVLKDVLLGRGEWH